MIVGENFIKEIYGEAFFERLRGSISPPSFPDEAGDGAMQNTRPESHHHDCAQDLRSNRMRQKGPYG